MPKEVHPSISERSYNCPRCGVLCPQEHYRVDRESNKSIDTIGLSFNPVKCKAADPRFAMHKYRSSWDLFISVCTECKLYTIWENTEMIFPFTNQLPESAEDMPPDVKGIYNEAAQVFPHSKRASAALLRLAIETLLVNHLGIKKDSINNMIRSLVAKGNVPEYIQQGLDSLRYYGNQGIHLSQIDLNDDEKKVMFLFSLINIIVRELITKEKEIKTFYDELPDAFRQHIENRDK